MSSVQEYEDEIELIDLLKVIWKWKLVILSVTIIFTVIAGIASFYMTKIYSVSMSLNSGALAINSNGQETPVDSLINIQSLIQGEVFNFQILDAMKKKNIEPLPESLDFDVKISKGSNNITISYNTSDIKIGVFVLNELAIALQDKYKKTKVEVYKRNYDGSIQAIVTQIDSSNFKISNIKNDILSERLKNNGLVDYVISQIDRTKAQIDLVKKNIKTFKERILTIQSEIGKVQKNSNTLLEERNKFISDTITKDNILTAMVYSNTLQQNIAYANTLEDTIASLDEKIYKATDDLKWLEQDLENQKNKKTELLKQIVITVQKMELTINETEMKQKDLLENIQLLKFKKSNIQNIHILRSPTPGLFPIKPKKRLIVSLVFVSSLFLSLFASFFIEYIMGKVGEEK